MRRAGCTKGRGRQRQGSAQHRGVGHPARAGEGLLRGSLITSNTGIDPMRPTSLQRGVDDPERGSRLLLLRLGIASPMALSTSNQGRPLGDPHGEEIFSGGDGGFHKFLHERGEGRRPSVALPASECTVATSLPGPAHQGRNKIAAYKAKYGTSNPLTVRDLRLRGDEALGSDTIRASGSKQQVGRAQGSVRDHRASVGAGRVRVRQERRHDAEVRRPVEGLIDGEPVFYKTLTRTKTLS